MELRVGTFPAAPAESAHKSTRDLGVVGCSRRSSGGRIRVEHLLLSPTCHQPPTRSSSSPPPSPSPPPPGFLPQYFCPLHLPRDLLFQTQSCAPVCPVHNQNELSFRPGLLRTRDWLYIGGGSDSEVDNRQSTNTQGQSPHLAIPIQCLGRYCREDDLFARKDQVRT